MKLLAEMIQEQKAEVAEFRDAVDQLVKDELLKIPVQSRLLKNSKRRQILVATKINLD